MGKVIACLLALALAGCSDEIESISPSQPDGPLNVSGVWTFEGECALNNEGECTSECVPQFCNECHHGRAEDRTWYTSIVGPRIIEQNDEELIISDHIIQTAMGVELHGSIQVYSGRFLCGKNIVDETGTTLLYMEDGNFISNDHYMSTLSLASSRDGTTLCRIVWSVTGRRVE